MGGDFGFLGGEVRIERGTVGDYRELERFHYARGRPATWAGIWRVVFGVRSTGFSLRSSEQPEGWTPNLAAVGVLSWPTLACAIRERHFGIQHWTRQDKIAFVNANLRTISRIIVHPQFRGIGLASRLVRHLCQACPTRYVEAMSKLACVHPLFERGGMRRVQESTRIGAGLGGCPATGTKGKKGAYFVWERGDDRE